MVIATLNIRQYVYSRLYTAEIVLVNYKTSQEEILKLQTGEMIY